MAPKHQKTNDYHGLTELLVAKDNEMKQLLKLADEQSKVDDKMNVLKAQINKYDQEIGQLQKQLKEAELILSTAIFQAKQKLASISKANEQPINSEDLVKYAYLISSSHAVNAPISWQPGDLRRPYPNDIEMRLGLLGKTDLNGHSLPTTPAAAIAVTTANVEQRNNEIPVTQNQFAWNPSGELHMMTGGQQSISLVDTSRSHKDASQADDASSDSSNSSSSSDSQ